MTAASSMIPPGLYLYLEFHVPFIGNVFMFRVFVAPFLLHYEVLESTVNAHSLS